MIEAVSEPVPASPSGVCTFMDMCLSVLLPVLGHILSQDRFGFSSVLVVHRPGLKPQSNGSTYISQTTKE